MLPPDGNPHPKPERIPAPGNYRTRREITLAMPDSNLTVTLPRHIPVFMLDGQFGLHSIIIGPLFVSGLPAAP